jgi:hyaluronoglucosaminidase
MIPYTTKNVFSRGEYLSFQGNIQLNVINKFKMLEDYRSTLDENFQINYENYDLTLVVQYDQNLVRDGYNIQVDPKSNTIFVSGKSDRSIQYGLHMLNHLLEKDKDEIHLPIVRIQDEASFEMRGIIEGFYGTPWTQDMRLDVIDTMSSLKLNTFIYAPKDDLYHRDKWREPYPSEQLQQLLTYKEKCDHHFIDFYYSISPGKDFDYTNEQDFEFLFQKLKQVIEHGINRFALLFDDIDYQLKGKSLKQFKRAGIAHAWITNKVYQFIQSELFECSLIMCPTEYYQNYDTQYRNDLNNGLTSEVSVFWTGYNTVAEVITAQDSKVVKESLGHEIVLWENYPVNDFSKERIYLGPLINRDTELSEYHSGMVANPMNQWYASKIPLITMADYMWNSNKYNPELSLSLAIDQTVSEDYRDDLRLFIKWNEKSVLSEGEARIYKRWVLDNDRNAIQAYYESVERVVTNLIQGLEKALLNDLEPWFQRALLEVNLWSKIYSKVELAVEDVLEVIKHPSELGVNFIVDYLVKHYANLEIDYQQYQKKPRFNFWGL